MMQYFIFDRITAGHF